MCIFRNEQSATVSINNRPGQKSRGYFTAYINCKKLIQRIIYVNKDDRQVKEYEWILIYEITRGMQHPVTAYTRETETSSNILFFDRWQTFWHESQMPHRVGLILGQISRIKCPGIARGGTGGFGID